MLGMQPDQNNAGGIVPGPANQYDFIMNPPKPPKKSIVPTFGKNPFIQKIIFVVGGAIALMMLLWVGASLLFGGGNAGIEKAVGLAQSQQELIRVAALGADAPDQRTRNLAVNVQFTFTTQQNQLISYLSGRGRNVSEEELAGKLNAETDTRLETAMQSNTFDTAFNQTMENSLRAYVRELDSAYDDIGNALGRQLLQAHFEQVELLVKQVPKTS